MVRYAGRPPAPAGDLELFGFHALYRLYETSEGWVFLAVTNAREWGKLTALAPFAALARDARFRDEAGRKTHEDALALLLAEIFATRAAAAWERELRQADVACVVSAPGPVEASVTDADGVAKLCGFVTEVEHPTLERHPRLVPAVRFSRSRCVAGTGPTLGQHTDAVLHELGYDEARITDLRAKGVIGG